MIILKLIKIYRKGKLIKMKFYKIYNIKISKFILCHQLMKLGWRIY